MRQRGGVLIALGILILSLVLTPTLAGAESAVDRVLKSGEIRVGVVEQGTPLCIMSKDGSLMGLEVDLAGMLARAMEVKLNLRPMDRAKLIPALVKGEIDLALGGLVINPRLNTQVMLVGPYLASGQTIVSNQDTVKVITSLEAMNRKDFLLGAVRGSEGETAAKNLVPKAKLTLAQDWLAAVKLLQERKVMGLILDYPQAVLVNLRWSKEGLVSLKKPFTFEPLGMAVAPGERHLLNLVENYLLGLDGTGQLDGLRRIWFGDSSWLSRLP